MVFSQWMFLLGGGLGTLIGWMTTDLHYRITIAVERANGRGGV